MPAVCEGGREAVTGLGLSSGRGIPSYFPGTNADPPATSKIFKIINVTELR